MKDKIENGEIELYCIAYYRETLIKKIQEEIDKANCKDCKHEFDYLENSAYKNGLEKAILLIQE